MSNPRAFNLKKWFAGIMKEKVVKHEQIIERTASCLVTDKDMTDFGALIADLYAAAYSKAVEDCRGECEKAGVQLKVVSPQTTDSAPKLHTP
jgi:hypothetical protein